MATPTYGSRQGWPSARPVAAAHGRGLDVGFSWEQELGQGSVDQDTWLVSFVDILMLLLTLFVLLLAYKDGLVQTPPVKTATAAPVVEKVSVVIPPAATEAPHGQTEVVTHTPQPDVSSPSVQEAGSMKSATETVLESPADSALTLNTLPALRQSSSPRQTMVQIAGMPGMFGLPEVLEMPPTQQAEHVAQTQSKPETPAQSHAEKLLEELQGSTLKGRIEVNVLPDSVSLEISDSILFAPASAALTESGTQLLDELSTTLKTHPYTLSVEGHTDNVPIKTARFPSNWELSSARATEVTRRLIERGIAPERVRAVGYADTHPRADNVTVEGKARNRRVSLVLIEKR